MARSPAPICRRIACRAEIRHGSQEVQNQVHTRGRCIVGQAQRDEESGMRTDNRLLAGPEFRYTTGALLH
jgi:hypothetical protein